MPTLDPTPDLPSGADNVDQLSWGDVDQITGAVSGLAAAVGEADTTEPLHDRVTVTEADLSEIDTWAGRVVDMVTAAGQISRMVFVPAFQCEAIHPELGTGLHPAFRVGGVDLPGFWVGQYQGIISAGELISRPGVDPTVSTNFDTFSTAARAAGAGWHLMTNAEWAAIALWSLKQGYTERGNTQWGRSHAVTSEVGYRGDVEYAPNVQSGHGRTLTGSGPTTWRTPNSPFGIADLVGNVWEWVAGLRLDAGDIQVIGDNNAVTADLAAGSVDWMSLGLHFTDPAGGGSQIFNNVAIADEFDAPIAGSDLELMRRLGLMPLSDLRSNVGRVYQTATGERLPSRGGAWNNGSDAGWFARNLYHVRAYASNGIGARPALCVL